MAAIGRRNVQEQNADAKAVIRAAASSFNDDPLRFSWLSDVLLTNSLSPQKGILVSLSSIPDEGGELYSGLWLTSCRQFFKFSVLLPRNGSEVEVEEWRNVTNEIIVEARRPGTGKSFGLLSLEVLDELKEG
jgi:hypothetical protein